MGITPYHSTAKATTLSTSSKSSVSMGQAGIALDDYFYSRYNLAVSGWLVTERLLVRFPQLLVLAEFRGVPEQGASP